MGGYSDIGASSQLSLTLSDSRAARSGFSSHSLRRPPSDPKLVPRRREYYALQNCSFEESQPLAGKNHPANIIRARALRQKSHTLSLPCYLATTSSP